MPLPYITLEVGPTYPSSATTLAFRVDSRFTLLLSGSIDAGALARMLSNMTPEQLEALLGSMAALGLRIISVSVTGPDLVLLPAPSPPPPELPALAPFDGVSDALSIFFESGGVPLPANGAVLITSFIVALILPALYVFILYRRVKRAEKLQAESKARTHLELRKARGLSTPGVGGVADHSGLDRSWFDPASALPEEQEQAARIWQTPVRPRAAVRVVNEKARSNVPKSHFELRRRRQPGSRDVAGGVYDDGGVDSSWFDPASALPEEQDEQEQAARIWQTPARTPVPRSHFELRRRRPGSRQAPGGVYDDGGVDRSWFDPSWALPDEEQYENGCEPSTPPAAASPELTHPRVQPSAAAATPAPLNRPKTSSAQPSYNPRVPRSHIEIRRRRPPRLPSGKRGDPLGRGALNNKHSWFNASEASLVRLARQETYPSALSADSEESSAAAGPGSPLPTSAEDIMPVLDESLEVERRDMLPSYGRCTRAGGAAQYATRVEMPNTPHSPGGSFAAYPSVTSESRILAASLMNEPTSPNSPRTPPRPEIADEPSSAVPKVDTAASRSEAVMARARARARAKIDPCTPAASSGPADVSTQQRWLMEAMGAASEQDYAPVDIQQDWLSQAINQMPDEDEEEEAAPAPAALTPMNSPRAMLNALTSPRRSHGEEPLESPRSRLSFGSMLRPPSNERLQTRRPPSPRPSPALRPTPTAQPQRLNFNLNPDTVDEDSELNPNHLYV